MSKQSRMRFLLRLTPLLALIMIFGIAQAQQPVFRIGALGSEGTPLTRGARLAIEEINNAGGVTGADGTAFALELVVQPISDMDIAVSNIAQASVIAVLGPEESTDALANLAALQALGVPVLTPAIDDTLLALDSTERIFRIRSQELLWGGVLADYIVRDIAPQSVVTVQLDLESTAGIIGFTTALVDLGITPNNAFLLQTGLTVEDLAAQIAQNNPVVAVTYGAPALASALYVELRLLGWEGIFVYNRASDPYFRQVVPVQQYAGILGATSWTFAAEDLRSQIFTLSFLRAFGEVPTAVDVAAYDTIYLLATAIGQPGDLQTNLGALNNVTGVQGTLSPAALIPGEMSDNTFVTETSLLGGERVLARYTGLTRIPDETDVIVNPNATATPPPTATPEGVVATITRSVQNVRSGPGTNYDVIGQLRQGEQVQILGGNVGLTWIMIDFRGTQGWLSRDILEVFGDLNSLPIIQAPPTPTPPPATLTPTIAPVVDITILSATPTRLTIGVPFNVIVTVFNQGGASAGAFGVAGTFEPGGVYAGLTLPGLSGGQQTQVTLTGTLVGGTGPRTIVIVGDLNNQLIEGANGKANNNFNFTYIADAPILAPNGTGSLTVANTASASLDNGTPDISWNGGTLTPVGGTLIGVLGGFTNLDQVHKDAISTAGLSATPLTTVPVGSFVGIQTDGGANFGVMQITESTSGGNLVFTYRVYQ